MLDELEAVSISEVFVGGKSVAKDGTFTGEEVNTEKPPAPLMQSVNLPEIGSEKLAIPISDGDSIHVIEVIPNQLVTKKKVLRAKAENGLLHLQFLTIY